MAQHDMILDNQSGAAFRADANNALLALVGHSSGATAPATTYAYMYWADTTAGVLKMRNAANSAWLDMMTLSTADIVALQTHAGAIKTTFVDADEIPLADSAASFGLKRLPGANLKATIGALVQIQSWTAFTTAGTATAFTGAPTPPITVRTAGQRFNVTLHATAGANPTLAISGLAARALMVKNRRGQKFPLSSYTGLSGSRFDVVDDGTDYVIENMPPVHSTGTFTRDISLANGNVSITGVGFKPSKLILRGAGGGLNQFTGCVVDIGSLSQNSVTAYNVAANGTVTTTNNLGFLENPNTGFCTITISSLDNDGFTVTFTKSGSPTGTYTIAWEASL